MNTEHLVEPKDGCGVCSGLYVRLSCDVNSTKLGHFIDTVARTQLGFSMDEEVEGVEESGRLILDPEYTDNSEKSLASIGINGVGSRITIGVEGQGGINFAIVAFVRHVYGASLCVDGGDGIDEVAVMRKAFEIKRVKDAKLEAAETLKRKREEEDGSSFKKIKADETLVIDDDDVLIV